MNSQIYCLPQKFGWNAFPDTRPPRPKKETFKNENTTFLTVKFDGHEINSEVRQELQKRYPKLYTLGSDAEEKAQALVYTSETAHSFRPLCTYSKTYAPVTLEKRADPMKSLRTYDPPFQTLMPSGPGSHNDPDRSFYPWRQLQANSNNAMWQPLVKQDWPKEFGERNTLPPVRLHRHDPTHEKQRWDYLRHLSRINGLSYPFRRDVIGYTGHKPWERHITYAVESDLAQPNPAMESTTQAVHKEFPNEDYQASPDHAVNKHQGPMSRMVTLTHPYNPFTQQSAYSNVGASGTQ